MVLQARQVRTKSSIYGINKRMSRIKKNMLGNFNITFLCDNDLREIILLGLFYYLIIFILFLKTLTSIPSLNLYLQLVSKEMK